MEKPNSRVETMFLSCLLIVGPQGERPMHIYMDEIETFFYEYNGGYTGGKAWYRSWFMKWVREQQRIITQGV